MHYRAPPNERGSGKERGHGVELPICPACGEELEPGKHHNKCKAGRTTNPPSKRVPKAGASNARNAKNSRGPAAATAKRKPKREAHNAESNSGNSFDASFLPAQMAQHAHDGLDDGVPHHSTFVVRSRLSLWRAMRAHCMFYARLLACASGCVAGAAGQMAPQTCA